MTHEELDAYGEQLSDWAESDDFFEALETATVRIKGQDSMPIAEAKSPAKR